MMLYSKLTFAILLVLMTCSVMKADNIPTQLTGVWQDRNTQEIYDILPDGTVYETMYYGRKNIVRAQYGSDRLTLGDTSYRIHYSEDGHFLFLISDQRPLRILSRWGQSEESSEVVLGKWKEQGTNLRYLMTKDACVVTFDSGESVARTVRLGQESEHLVIDGTHYDVKIVNGVTPRALVLIPEEGATILWTSTSDANKVKQPPHSKLVVEKLIWETSGGGHLVFDVVPSDNGYKIHLANKSFQQMNVHLDLTAEAGNAYTYVNDIFTGKHIPKGSPASKLPTGSWTSITLVTNGEANKMNNYRGGRALYEFVATGGKPSSE